jgi:transposase
VLRHGAGLGIDVEVVPRRAEKGFHVLPRRWVVERTFGWLMQYRRLVRDSEPGLSNRSGRCRNGTCADPTAAHARLWTCRSGRSISGGRDGRAGGRKGTQLCRRTSGRSSRTS